MADWSRRDVGRRRQIGGRKTQDTTRAARASFLFFFVWPTNGDDGQRGNARARCTMMPRGGGDDDDHRRRRRIDSANRCLAAVAARCRDTPTSTRVAAAASSPPASSRPAARHSLLANERACVNGKWDVARPIVSRVAAAASRRIGESTPDARPATVVYDRAAAKSCARATRFAGNRDASRDA